MKKAVFFVILASFLVWFRSTNYANCTRKFLLVFVMVSFVRTSTLTQYLGISHRIISSAFMQTKCCRMHLVYDYVQHFNMYAVSINLFDRLQNRRSLVKSRLVDIAIYPQRYCYCYCYCYCTTQPRTYKSYRFSTFARLRHELSIGNVFATSPR